MSISISNNAEWLELSISSHVSSWFQTPYCLDFYYGLSECFEPFVYSIHDNEKLKGVTTGYITKGHNCIKQSFTRRAIINGGPLLADDISASELEELLQQLICELKKKVIYVEIRNFNDYSPWKDTFEKCGFLYEPHYNFHVDTSSVEVVEANLGKSRKRDIRVSQREGAELVYDPTLLQVKAFYALLENLYRTKVKTPLFPWSFFEKLYEHPDGKFILVSYKDRIIGGTVCVCQASEAMYEWFACGEDGVYKDVHPSTLATYGAIRYAATHGMPLFDMMGAGAPGDNGYGVRDFKAKFGGKLVEHGRFKYICSPLLYKIGCLGVKILKSL